ncbi:hypothetical protein DRQ50_01230 [bacterium]|nr:MAG: hypothetical protein DRQ50_01230 [bacterium]
MNVSDTATTTVPAAGEPRPLPSLPVVMWIAWFSMREMVRRKRLVSLGLLNLLPVLAVLAVRIFFRDEPITAQQQLTALTYDVIVPFLLPVMGMAVGASAIGEQVEEGTIVYLWTRPIRRRAIYLGRLVAAQTVAVLVPSLALVACFVIMVSKGPDVITWAFLKLYLGTFGIILLGASSYTALFAAFGTWVRKPVVPAILFAFGWENLVSEIPARVQELSLRFHLQNLVERPQVADTSDLPGLLGALLTTAFKREPVPDLQSVAVLILTVVVASVAGVWLLRHKEIEN